MYILYIYVHIIYSFVYILYIYLYTYYIYIYCNSILCKQTWGLSGIKKCQASSEVCPLDVLNCYSASMWQTARQCHGPNSARKRRYGISELRKERFDRHLAGILKWPAIRMYILTWYKTALSIPGIGSILIRGAHRSYPLGYGSPLGPGYGSGHWIFSLHFSRV